MLFKVGNKMYVGESALEIVGALKLHRLKGRSHTVKLREFLHRSFADLSDRVHLRELDVSDRLNDELLALSYLYLCDEYGAGELKGVPRRSRWARPL